MTCVRHRDSLSVGRRPSATSLRAPRVERRARLAHAHMSPIADAGAVAKYLADAGAVAKYLAGVSPALQAVVVESTRLP